MIPLNVQLPAVSPQLRVQFGVQPAAGPDKEIAPQDGVSFSQPSSVSGEAPTLPVGDHPGNLGQTGLSTALQSLPPEGTAAKLLESARRTPMTEAQRDACIADLETLNMAGYLKSMDPETLEYSSCSPTQALQCLANGDEVYYRGGKQGPLTSIAGLQTLADLARQAQMGRVG
ncbi:hypothetical protein IV102_03135 [bacterium]|nr:hypothetical protein [bacterium]